MKKMNFWDDLHAWNATIINCSILSSSQPFSRPFSSPFAFSRPIQMQLNIFLFWTCMPISTTTKNTLTLIGWKLIMELYFKLKNKINTDKLLIFGVVNWMFIIIFFITSFFLFSIFFLCTTFNFINHRTIKGFWSSCHHVVAFLHGPA